MQMSAVLSVTEVVFCSNHYGTGHDVHKATFGVHQFEGRTTNDFGGGQQGVDVINNFQCRRLDLSHGVKAILSEEAEGTGSDAS